MEERIIFYLTFAKTKLEPKKSEAHAEAIKEIDELINWSKLGLKQGHITQYDGNL